MENVLIDNELKKGWSLVDLRALVPDEALYSVMFIQPSGALAAGDAGVKNFDAKAAAVKYRRFLALAANKKADLAVTPEYSCPWRVVAEAVKSVGSKKPTLPPEGAVWVLGCESITPGELDALAARCGGATWLYDKLQPTATAKFLDPVCYLFWALDEEKQSRLVALVQFKGQSMSDHSKYLERDNMIKGKKRYVLRNGGPSIRLTTLICSDALRFNMDSLRGETDPAYLVVHPQLNMGPRHAGFATYRKNAYQHKYSEGYELLCVNWSRGFDIHGLGTSDFGGSAFYTKGRDVILGDDAIEANHRKGLYYTFCETHHTSIYFFNYAEHVFYFQTTKASQADAMSALAKRTGPKMIDTYSWDAAGRKWLGGGEPDDEFRGLCDEVEAGVHAHLEQVACSVNRERLLLLSSGSVGTKARRGKEKERREKKWDASKSWVRPQNLPTFLIKEDEVINRITVAQDPYPAGRDTRRKYLTNYAVLVTEILPDPKNFPRVIDDLAKDNVIRYPIREDGRDDDEERYHRNLCRKDGGRAATVAYVGEQFPGPSQRLYDDLLEGLHPHVRSRLVVWYRHQGVFGCHPREGDRPKINDVYESPRDFRRAR